MLFPCVTGYYYNAIAKMIRSHFSNIKALKVSIIIAFFVCQLFWTTEYNVWNAGCNVWEPGALPKILFRGGIGILGCLAMKIIFDFTYDKISKKNALIRGGTTWCCYAGSLYLSNFTCRKLWRQCCSPYYQCDWV